MRTPKPTAVSRLKTSILNTALTTHYECWFNPPAPVQDLIDLYQPSPAGFAGQLILVDGSRYSWELWQEAEEMWNFQSTRIS